ncbi:zinc finger, CCHC-type, Retrotransposon gag domain protein [Artemisia annua]|uniref:Zinc finger, CCHC-type, Retrotransposon gag domain protein n=1 Tax=Artemisia annua TaxID=35608 RepID=A0A2U1L8C0_ARTAN|nr:zinc finger, CCHC-type, Retrotransposon gag domain protein [Artemisia annua]
MIPRLDTTGKHDDFANNPAFKAAVQRTVDALLPNISVRIQEEVRQEMANATDGSGGSGGGNDYVATLSWASFREIFLSQYFPLSEKEKYEREYHTIAMGDKETSTEFMKRFVRLAGFLGEKAGTQVEQARKFKWALRKDLLNGVVNLHFDDIAGVANAVRNIEIADERVKQGVKRNYDGEPVRPAQGIAQRGNEFRGNDRRGFDTRGSDRQGSNRRGYDNHGNDRRNDRRGFDTRGYDRQGYNNQRSGRDQQQNRGQQNNRTSGSYGQRGNGNQTVCKFCGKSHPGSQCYRAARACFICGDTRHMARDCPQKSGTNNNRGNGNDRQPAATRERVFSTTRDQAANSSAIEIPRYAFVSLELFWAEFISRV